MTDATNTDALEQRVQLHEDVTVWYVVDGYEAMLNVDDGGRHVLSGRGDTIADAIEALRVKASAYTLDEIRRMPKEDIRA